MVIENFLNEPMHPEETLQACLKPLKEAVPISPVFDESILSLGMISQNDHILAAVVRKEENRSIKLYKSQDSVQWNLTLEIDRDYALESCRLFIFNNRVHMILTGVGNLCCIYRLEGKTLILLAQLHDFLPKISDPSVLVTDKDSYLLYNNCLIVPLTGDLKNLAGEPREIEFDLDSFRNVLGKNSRPALDYREAFSPVICYIDGLYHLFMTDIHQRGFSPRSDTFVSVSNKPEGPYSRRYLILPSAGSLSPFKWKGELYAGFIGRGEFSPVENRANLVKFLKGNSDYYYPDPQYIYEMDRVNRIKPIENIEIRDPYITLGPDKTYYLTGTTRRPGGTFWKDTDGIHIWKSNDLNNWKSLGKVFDYHDTPESWQFHATRGHNQWAPELAYFNDTWWITYSPNPACAVLKSVSGLIDGPYVDMGKFVNNNIDSGYFIDGDGEVYFVYQNGKIARLSEDGSCFAEEPVMLLPTDGQQVGYEGAGIMKILGKYVLYAAEWNGDSRLDGTYDMMYSWSDHLYGPYRPRRILVPHGGHGCLFRDKEDYIRFTLFGNDRTAPFRRGVGIGQIKARMQRDDLILEC